MVNENIIIVTQARIGSTRFPGKVLKRLGEGTMLSTHLARLQKSKLANKILVATTFEENSEEILSIAKDMKVSCFQGSTSDVLDRFYHAVQSEKPRLIVRVTSDCPLIDATLIDNVIEMVINEDLDYGANILKEEFPDGQDVEVFTFDALEKAWSLSELKSDREHVTTFIRRNSTYLGGQMFHSNNYSAPANYNSVRMTVDEPADLITIQRIVEVLGENRDWLSYTNYIIENKKELNNQQIVRNEGFIKSLNND